MKLYLQLILLSLLPIFVFSQTTEEKKEITKDYNLEKLEELARIFKSEAEFEKQKALELAQQNGWIVRQDVDGVLYELMRVTEEGTPLYYVTNNVDAATSTRAYTLHNGSLLGLNVEGQNMTAHVWDGGLARTSHQEYDGIGGSNRFSIGDGTTALHYHSAHVTGTIIASGYVAQAKGMAPQADAVGYDWNADVTEATTAAGNGMLLSNHSYGWGASSLPDWYFGAYVDYSREWDVVMYNADYYLMVCSAGNDGLDNTSNGDPLDGNFSYDKLSGFKTSKNTMVVANAQDANIDANGNLISVAINTGSSEGPTDDYRIKPDITGNGTGLYSSYASADDAYNSISGTSMASPNVCGTLLLLQQHYNNINSNFMRASTLKGLALHTTDDIGPTGPDVVHGWGLLNAKAAANAITNNGNLSIINELTLNQGGSYTIDVASDGVNDLVASISWTDPPGPENTGTSNDNTPVLVNDLDIRITQGGSTYYPYRLTSITTNGTGDNVVDPYEQIIISGASGAYTITVNHKGSLYSGNQKYALIVTGTTVTSLTAGFTGSPTSICTNGSVDFSDISIGSPTSWTWSFPGGTPNSFIGQNPPAITYNTGGVYDVSLMVGDGITTDTELKTGLITVENIIADFSGSPTTIFAGNSVTFTDNSSCSPSTWNWSFPGGTPSSASGPGPHTITYNIVGTYNVSLTVSNASFNDTETKTSYIEVTEVSYCTPTYSVGTSAGDYISLVQLGDIDNATGPSSFPFYSYYSSLSTDLTQDDNYTITLSPGDYESGNNIAVWIDYNRDGIFDEVTEKLGTALIPPMPATGTLNFTVPTDATVGTTRMRVREVWNDLNFDACSSYSYGETEDYNINILSKDIRLDLTAMLEGPYNSSTNTMETTLNSLGYLPTLQPYNPPTPYYGNSDPIWKYIGAETVASIPVNVVDWVVVQLRDANSPATATSATIVDTQAGLLLSNGTIVATDGVSPLSFNVTITQGLYVVIYHRNHLGIISNYALTESGGIYSYNFSSGENQAYGGASAHKQLETGVWGMIAADGDADGNILPSDETNVWVLEVNSSGYLGGDYDLNGLGQPADKTGFWVPNSNKAGQIPGKSSNQGYKSFVPK